MLRKTHLFLIVLFTVFLLFAGCGKSDSESTESKKTVADESPQTGEENEDADDETKDHANHNGKTNPINEKADEQASHKDDSETGQKADHPKNQNAKTQKSDQHYSISVFSGYQLTGEEPGRDVLYDQQDDAFFMRIEILPAESDLYTESQTMKDQLEAVGSRAEDYSKTDDSKQLSADKAYQASNGNEKVSGFLISKEDSIIKLTIFNPDTGKHTEDPFISMANTIALK